MAINKRTWRTENGKHQTRYDVQLRKRGAPQLFKSFGTRVAAESWEREQLTNIERGTWRPTRQAEMMTLNDALDLYIKDVLPEKRSTEWVKTMARAIRDDSVAKLPLIALASDDLAGYRDRRSHAHVLRTITRGRGEDKVTTHVETDRKISTETVRKELSLIGRVIDHVRREAGVHLAAGNPTKLVRRPRPGKGRDRRLQPGEEDRLLAAARVNPDEPGGAHARTRYLEPVLIFALETASRRGELCMLDWKDVDLKKRTAILRDTKNGEDRVIPLSTRAADAIQTLPRYLRGGQVFQVTPAALTCQWKRLVKRAGIEDLRFHDLRHEAVSRLFEKGLNPMEVASVSGHKTLQMLKRYTHLKAEDLARRLG